MDSVFNILQLAQVRPSNGSFVTAYTATDPTVISSIVITNSTSGIANFSICCDIDGTTFTEATALFWHVPLAGHTTTTIEMPITLIRKNTTGLVEVTQGSIGVQSNTANALTFTIQGYIQQV